MKQKKKQTPGLTPLEEARLELFYAHQYNYHTLIRQRMATFDTDGSLEITKADGTKQRQDGRKWIEDHIRYFEKKDDTVWYKMRAKLTEVLDEYDDKFKK